MGVAVIDMGVAVVTILGVGDGERPGIVSTCPSASELGSAILFDRTISSTVTPNMSAIPERVSPAFTRYVTGGTVGAAIGVGVGEATGVTTSSIGWAEPPAPPQADSKRSRPSNSHPVEKSRLIRSREGRMERGKAVPTYGFLDVMPVSGMVGTSGSWSCGCDCGCPCAPAEGAPGADG